MRVLTVIDSLGFGGAERLLPTLGRAAPKVGMELEVASLAPWTPERTTMAPRLEEAGITPRFLGVRRLADRHALAILRDCIRASHCDVVHAHLGYAATLAPLAARLERRPSVATLHTLPNELSGREVLKERLCIASAGRSGTLVFVSEAARRAFASRYRCRDSWRVVPNGIDLEMWAPGPGRLPADLPVPSGVPLVAIVAALRAPKGHALAVAAWPLVLRECPDARLLIVGDGDERESLEAQVARAGLVDHVLFTGRLNEAETADVMRACDVTLLPSYREALPTTLIESAACATPVVATDVGGAGEVVEDGVSGVLVASGRIGAIAEEVIGLLRDPVGRRRMGQAGRRIAVERFDMHVWATRLHGVYEETLNGTRAHTATTGRVSA